MPSRWDSQQPYAIVIGLDNPTGLQTARILARRKVPVIALAKDPNHYCCRTNVCREILFVNPENNELIRTLETLGPQLNQKAVLFPCEDLSVLLLSRHRQQLEQWYHLMLPAPDIVELMLDKGSFYTYAQQKGFPIPRTFFINNREEAEHAAKKLRFPCVLKPPVKSLEWQRHSQSKVFKVSNAEELLTLVDSCKMWTETLIVQEWIEGTDTNHYSCNCYFNSASEPVVTFISRKLRQWPPETGQGCLAVECRDEVVLRETVRLFQSVPYRGLAYLEMKRDERSGEYLIVEPNIGRPTGRSAMAEAGGVDLLYTMYCDAIGWPLPENLEQKYKAIKWIHLRRDVPEALSRWRQGSLTFQEWWRSYRGPIIDAIFSWHDPLPFLAEMQGVMRRFLFKLLKAVTSRPKYLWRFNKVPQPNIFRLLSFFVALSCLSACNSPWQSRPETTVATAAVEEAAVPSSPPEIIPAVTPAMEPSRLKRTIYPEQLAGYIPNPHMGWQDTQRKNKRFVETVGYKRLNWNVLNPARGVYDWSPIESLRADMARHNGAISFRIRTAQPPPWGEGQTMPTWLVKQGVMVVEGHSEVENVRSTEPLYAGCLFLEAHGEFIEALRQRYDGEPDVAFIDIGSYGTYGEWDSEQYDDEPNSLDWHARRRIIDMYLGGKGTRPCVEADNQITEVAYDYPGFQHTQLIMPYTPWFADSLVYALSRRADIGIRHDALGSKKHHDRYREEIGNWVAQRWPQVPIIFEFTTKAHTLEALREARDFAQEMHASFVHENFTGKGSNELIDELLAVIGYRLVLREMTYTSELAAGETLSVEMVWENTGVAPPYYQTYPLVLSLTDAQGRSRLQRQLEPDIRDWLPGKEIQLQTELPLPTDFPAGIYDLRVAFVDPVNKQPILALAIAGRDEQGWYLLGQVNSLRHKEDAP